MIGVPDDEAIRAGRELAATEGLLAGISSGAAVYAARQLSQRQEFKNKKIVACYLIRENVICLPSYLHLTRIRWIDSLIISRTIW